MMSDPYFWVAVSFLIFIAIAWVKVWPSLAAALDSRAVQIRASLDEAAALRAQAEAMLRQAEADRAAALAEAETLIARAKAEAERVAANAATEAEAAAARRERMAMGRIAAAEASALAEVRNAATEVAIAASRALLAEQVTPAVDAKLVDSSVAELPQALRAA
ncbi:MAG TPA: F0F1 ATP synthase subunit B [Acetobacteraceae bacterium]|nr:F0F1 ATP synthase subunit B [Acetobacteraceae bacterium]